MILILNYQDHLKRPKLLNEKVYLETTAIIDAVLRIKKYPKLASILLPSNKKYSSQYTKMEIKRGFLNNLVLLHNRICISEKWSDVEDYIYKLSAGLRRNQLSTILGSMAVYWKNIEKLRPEDLKEKYGERSLSDIMKESSISFLRTWIKYIFKKMDKVCDEILDPMKCFNDLCPPLQEGHLFSNKPVYCKSSKIQCEVKQFFSENSQDFNKIFEGLKKIPENKRDTETQKRIPSLKKILKKLFSSTKYFNNHSQDEKLCWNCGDAIHVVLAPSNALVANRNKKHFEDICNLINKKNYSY